MFSQLASQLGEGGKGYVTAGTGVREDRAKGCHQSIDLGLLMERDVKSGVTGDARFGSPK